MPKIIEYPRASLKNCLVLADAIDELGGQCVTELAADRLKKKVSGAFVALIGSAVKYGLVVSKKNQLSTTQLYRDIKLAYDEQERAKFTQKAFLCPVLFSNIYKRFINKKLPIEHFEKMLIREFSVADKIASQVSGYFIEGAKQSQLLDAENVLQGIAIDGIDGVSNNEEFVHQTIDNDVVSNQTEQDSSGAETAEMQCIPDFSNVFSVRIKGPGMDSTITVNEEEDLIIVQAMLRKVEKRLTQQKEVEI